ncbi:uncharacterized protein LOC108736107 [Agrilus planipennis]|uniref:Uncharacterized protein LOC108736107 n=1 Tax=Agrilus planipennis TaxID=224129 RepID=A0A1W4WIZ9_AGRPL|nr:uncharacterized protein LOC108736107 [Agrilus planipennis]
MSRVRNDGCVPYLKSEGTFLKPIPTREGFVQGKSWYTGLTPYERLFSHHTLASARQFGPFVPHKGLIPQDDLDFVMVATYDHSFDTFQDRVDTVLQPETRGINTWRRLRNTRDVQPPREARIASSEEAANRYNSFHPVLIGGIKEREHPHHIKLMNSSHHSPQTIAGYVRQDRDGSLFQY